ncbi:hypothetical protein [Rossellomorea sp. RS05]|uniref:hypothetical protein n=1 Tax=Rossellomorea sp. RS05 TaxID=3149166 RepID=UPI001C46ECC1|nr:hypothetical protein [Bacillus sp. JRC01]
MGWSAERGPFRFAAAGRFPAGRQLSRFGFACRVSNLPLFPRESAVLCCTALFGGSLIQFSTYKGFGEGYLYPIQHLWGSEKRGAFRFAAGARFPRGVR